jgi:CheY-like chemotaxis protein
MSQGPNHPGGHGGKRRRRRGRRAQGHRPPQGQPGNQQQPASARSGAGIYTAPMDHSYRLAQGENGAQPAMRGRGGRHQAPALPKHFQAAEIEPLPAHVNGAPRIFAFIEDLFFVAKIQETSRKLNVKVEFVKTDADIVERLEAHGGEKPSLIIFDLNNYNAKPLTLIPKLKTRFKKGTTIIGFLSHIQGDLKLKAQEAGCDVVVPRSAFSQNLPQLLRRHGAPEDLEEA